MALSTPAVDLPIQESGVKIKKEKEDDSAGDHKEKSSINKVISSDPQLSGLQSRNITITAASSQSSKTGSLAKPSVQITKKQSSVDKTLKEEGPPPIDHSSICGAFGWATFGSVHLPVIVRGEEKFISVRMFENKVVYGHFPDIFPTSLFSCTSVVSYYITVNESKLLNEINSFHCDYQFGYAEFTMKDYVVHLQDAQQLFDFLEFSQTKLYKQISNSVASDKCGFFLSYKVPYVKKGNKKYISLDLIYPEGSAPAVTTTETISNWDLAYFRLLSFFAPVDLQKIEINKSLCNVEDLEAVLGVKFDEVQNWPDIQCSSKEEWESFLQPRTLQWIPESSLLPSSDSIDDTKRLRKKLDELQDKEIILNSFLGKYLNTSVPRAAHVSSEPPKSLDLGDKNIFNVSLENFLATSSCNYPYPVNYNHYNSHIRTPSVLEYEKYRKSDGSTSLPSQRPRPFPPPPPLVRVGSPRVSSVPTEQGIVPKTSPLYQYIASPSNPSCPPWFTRLFDSDWLRDEENRALLQSTDAANLCRRLSESDAWSSTSVNLNGAGSSHLARSNSNPLATLRDNFDLTNERLAHPPGGSPRLLTGPGPPPHYPTPPQSSPLTPMSLLECASLPGFTDVYGTRLTPNGLGELCSPPPSPDMRTALSGSPRAAAHLSAAYGYQPHMTRLVQVDSRYVLAVNVEPLKYNSHLAVPISDVVNKFLRGTSVQSCQIMLETVFGLHLYECTSLQQEAFLKHNFSILPGSKLVLLTDLKGCLYQLKLLLERDKQSGKQCNLEAELPLAKRWCGNTREC